MTKPEPSAVEPPTVSTVRHHDSIILGEVLVELVRQQVGKNEGDPVHVPQHRTGGQKRMPDRQNRRTEAHAGLVTCVASEQKQQYKQSCRDRIEEQYIDPPALGNRTSSISSYISDDTSVPDYSCCSFLVCFVLRPANLVLLVRPAKLNTRSVVALAAGIVRN